MGGIFSGAGRQPEPVPGYFGGSDVTPYDEDEIEVIRECNADKKIF